MKIVHFYTNLNIIFKKDFDKNIKKYKIFNLFNLPLDFFYNQSISTAIINFFSAFHCIIISFLYKEEILLITCEAERPYFRLFYNFIRNFKKISYIIFLPGYLYNLDIYSYLDKKSIVSINTFKKIQAFKKDINYEKVNLSLYPRLWNNLENLSIKPSKEISLNSIVIISQYRDYLEKPNNSMNSYQRNLKFSLFNTVPKLIEYLKQKSIKVYYLPAYKDRKSKQSIMEEAFFSKHKCGELSNYKLNPYVNINSNSLFISFNSTLSLEYSYLSIASIVLDSQMKLKDNFFYNKPELILDFYYKYKFNRDLFLSKKHELESIKENTIRNLYKLNSNNFFN
tara:strand:- start:41 stop:1057 length:1017 start_codon:yes stop_codon:yes gene_type:complete